MTILEFTLLVWAGSMAAGFLGALTGLGGGVVLVPLLSLLFHVDIRYAVGASLVSVIPLPRGPPPLTFAKAFPTYGSECFSRSPPRLAPLWARFSPPKL